MITRLTKLQTGCSLLLQVLCFACTANAGDKAAAPQLASIFPTSPKLPANHLKFYLHFSEPMRQGVFMEHCTLLDDHGRPVLEPFRETELWSEDRKRLTLWLHPGRQKTGVNLNTELGPVLRSGARFMLVISGKWPSENGVALGRDVEKPFFATERATKQLDLREWVIAAPQAGTTRPLVVRFPAPLDHALLMRCLRVIDTDHKSVEGTVSTADFEKVWQFTPVRQWASGVHSLEVDSILEDLAGNSLARPFEVDITAAPLKKTSSVLSLPFQVTEH